MAKEEEGKDKDSEGEGEEAKAPPKSRKKLIIIIAAIVLVSAIGVGVTLMLLPGHPPADEHAAAAGEAGAAEDGKPKKPRKGGGKPESADANYYAFDPPFIVNFRDQAQARFLQVEVQVMALDPAVIETIKKHMPRIRNDLILLFSSQKYETLSTREGKEKMRDEALFEIRKILKEETGNPGVEGLYFTTLIMQ
ncbi:MAG: flagellar FliL protein [Gammaproteobacteria bacterium]|nr:MAG: flagellar FliL protein [Gammaproteobacteria bacterium]TND06733.1 MAG: flagellar FliL protein [Gammaproteobacteria bacterium]